jgi:RNA polymerase sigma-70 factor (ECF subfamily)
LTTRGKVPYHQETPFAGAGDVSIPGPMDAPVSDGDDAVTARESELPPPRAAVVHRRLGSEPPSSSDTHLKARAMDAAGGSDLRDMRGLRDPGEQIDLLMPYLHAMARKLTGNAHDASDLVQDALVRAIRALPGLPAGTDLRPWLATIVRHLHVDRLRQLAREPLPVPLDETSAAALAATQPPGPDDPPSRPNLEKLDNLEQALGELPEEFRRVFVLHALEGRSYRDIADSLGIPMATVGTRLSRARLKLRGLLGGNKT